MAREICTRHSDGFQAERRRDLDLLRRSVVSQPTTGARGRRRTSGKRRLPDSRRCGAATDAGTPSPTGESHMEIFDSFFVQNGSIGFESFVPKARRILKLPGEPFGKSYAIALPSPSRFLYLLHPDIGRSSDTADGNRRSVLLRRGTVPNSAATISPYGNVCSREFLQTHSGSVMARCFWSIHVRRRFAISVFRCPVRMRR
jgi:hypothetical protein